MVRRVCYTYRALKCVVVVARSVVSRVDVLGTGF